MARELVLLPRFKRDYPRASRHPEFDRDTLELVFELLLQGKPLPTEFREHHLKKRTKNWAGLTECHLGADLLLIYRVRSNTVIMHRIGTHRDLFSR